MNHLVPDDTNGAADVFVVDRQTGEIERVSVSSEGQEGNYSVVFWPSISDDGRIVSFASSADNLVPGDNNGFWDVFVRDRQFGVTTRISVSPTGEEANDDSGPPTVTPDGRYVVFDSTASNLITGGVLGQQVYRHDLQTGMTELVSATAAGAQANGTSHLPDVSADGRFVAFISYATDMYLGEPTDAKVYLFDRDTDELERISVNLAGQQGTEPSYTWDISADGRFVLFTSASPNLVPGVQNDERDVYVRDRRYNFIYRVSLPDGDGESNGFSNQSSITADGQTITLQSEADNLVPDDTNEESDIFVRIQPHHTLFLPALSTP